MEFKRMNNNSEIVLRSTLNHVDFFLIVKITFKNGSYKLFFSRRCSNSSKNKIVPNFLITNPNEMNQSYLYRQKYNLRKIKFDQILKYFLLPIVPCFELIWT